MSDYKEKDLIDVVIDGEVQRVPKAWKGTWLLDASNVSFDAAEEDSDEVEIPDGDPAESWTNKQLDAYATKNSIDLGGAGNKADKLEAIAKAKVL